MFREELYSSLKKVSAALLERNLTLGTAESCTGGLLAALCTEVPGSSAWFSGSIVAYSNCIKEQVLHVPADVLAQYGAVSEEVAGYMAAGGAKVLNAACCVSITGIAGPDGGTPKKPVGTVCIATAVAHHSSFLIVPKQHLFTGDRQAVRMAALVEGLALLYAALTE